DPHPYPSPYGEGILRRWPLLPRRHIDRFQARTEADQSAALAVVGAVRADAPRHVVVAVDPGAVAAVLAGPAGDRHRFLLAGLEQPDLVAARPDLLAVLAEELHRNRAAGAVPDVEEHVGLRRLRREDEPGEQGKKARLAAHGDDSATARLHEAG